LNRTLIVIENFSELQARLLEHVLGTTQPREKTEEELRWEDDGGALCIDTEGWEHTIHSAIEGYVTFG
jgi:hypothetical protein